jgi:hypothetical protein
VKKKKGEKKKEWRGIRAKRVKLLDQKEGTSWPTHV